MHVCVYVPLNIIDSGSFVYLHSDCGLIHTILYGDVGAYVVGYGAVHRSVGVGVYWGMMWCFVSFALSSLFFSLFVYISVSISLFLSQLFLCPITIYAIVELY